MVDLTSVNKANGNCKQKKSVRWGVFTPMFLLIFSAVMLGVFKSEMLIEITKGIFNWSLQNFGWLYQWISIFKAIKLIPRSGHSDSPFVLEKFFIYKGKFHSSR